MKKVNYAIIGFGGIAENRIAREGFGLDGEHFRPLPEARLVGVTDLAPSRRANAEALGLKWYPSVESVASDRSIDAVFIATDNLSHVPVGEKLMAAGKHLIIEKPMATTLAGAAKLMDMADGGGISLAVDHMMVYNGYNRRAQELISGGELGPINDISLHMEFPYGFTPEEAGTWRCANPAEIGGPIGDVASHCLYMAEFLLSDPIAAIQATYTPVVSRLHVENGAFLRFRTERGIRGSVRVSFADLRGAMQSIFLNLGYEVYGNRQTLRAFGTLFQLSGHVHEPVALRLELDDFGKSRPVRVGGRKNIYQQVIRRHALSIRRGPRMTGEDGFRNLKLVLAAYESAGNGGREIAIN
jgi:predicted dehydrogenase